MEGSNLNIWIKADSASRRGRRQLSPPGSPVHCGAITSSWQEQKMEGSNLNTWIKARQVVHVKKQTAGFWFWFVAAIYPTLKEGWQSCRRAESPIGGLAVL
jgi:hypothetical protein